MPIGTFPISFGWTPLVETIEGTELAWVESHCEDGTALLLSQFRDKPRLEAALCALLAGVQDLDDAAWSLLTERWLATAVGVQLDRIGLILDYPRQGWYDETYRVLLGAQILTLRSKGRWQDLARILDVTGVDLELAEFDEPGVAAIRIIVGEPFTGDVTGEDVFRLLARAKGAAIRLTFEFPTVAIDESFTWADADVEQADNARGWADDGETLGGYWADALGTSEGV